MVESLFGWGITEAVQVGDLINLTGIIINSVLTIGLLYLYKKLKDSNEEQNELQKKQTDIMEGQEELLEEDYRPQLDVNTLKIPGISDYYEPGEASLGIGFINYGRGPALTPTLSVKIEGEEIIEEFGGALGREPSIMEQEYNENELESNLSTNIPPDSKEYLFEAVVAYKYPKLGEGDLYIHEVLKKLDSMNIGTVEVTIDVIYHDLIDEIHTQNIETLRVEMEVLKDEQMSFEEDRLTYGLGNLFRSHMFLKLDDILAERESGDHRSVPMKLTLFGRRILRKGINARFDN